MKRIDKYTRLNVAKDTDGGVTIRDEATGVVVSVIGTNLDANGPRGVVIEVWDYRGGRIERYDWTRGSMGQELRPGQVSTYTVEEQ